MSYLAWMEVEYLDIDKRQVAIDKNEILSLLGRSGGTLDQHTLELIEKYEVSCTEIMSPRGGYGLFGAVDQGSPDEVAVNGVHFKTGKIVRKLLRKAEQYAFFAATAGAGPENLARSLMEQGQFLEGYIVDLIGTGIVESVAAQIHQLIRTRMEAEGMKVTNRYSPGYCSWDVAEQQQLFGMFPPGFCEITLTESSLMFPIKSVSGIIGIGSRVTYQDYPCEACAMKQCIFRKTRK